MKNIYFVQVGFEFDGSVYLPYAAGTIIAYCQKDPKIKGEYEFQDIIFKREKLSSAMNRITDPYIVAFSCSVWNVEYNKSLAKMIKEKYPGCIVVFGGHSVNEDLSLLKSEPYIDILLFGEGESVFSSMLKNLTVDNLVNTNNIAYRSGESVIKTPRSYCGSLENFPSPYLDGVFDKILSENEGMDFLSVLETNRGCPYSCAYCDWCTSKKIRFFPLEKVRKEIQWLSENKISYCFCADSNFGMFDRDVEIANWLIEAKKNNGYPEVFRPCYEKNSADRVFKICSMLNSVGMDKGATMAYQTLCDEALRNIGRKNLTMEHFSSLMHKYNEASIPTYSELILGLPGETKESFCQGICKLLENGQHNSISVYHCEVLPNSEMAQPEFIEKHKIEVIKVAFNHIHSAQKKHEEVKEYSYLVRSTATMCSDDWVYANLFSVCVQCFHSLGLLRFIAIYLRMEKDISYYEFYISLLEYILTKKGKLNKLWAGFENKYKTSLDGEWNYFDEKLGNVTWFFEEGAFLEIVLDYEVYFKELLSFLKRYNIDDHILGELLNYQKAKIKKPFEKQSKIWFSYDFDTYFKNIITDDYKPLIKTKNSITVVPSKIYDDVSLYAKEVVWFGRRRGATIYGNEITKN